MTRLKNFIREMTILADSHADDEEKMLDGGQASLAALLAEDNWLPEEFARPDEGRYMQYLLHCDPLERFSVVSFVWAPGQMTPVHDHLTWGLIGMLRGAEESERYAPGSPPTLIDTQRLNPGEIEQVSPRLGDIHRVRNAFDDRVSISIHVYGGNIGTLERQSFDLASGTCKAFISGYANSSLPNIWGR
ncbi:cysteine dioxygenase [Acetobacteraceae bacterium H6797]|nr:cysteine dioxygenase [Acetobacteraceae bacterium H6797]